MDYYKKEFNFDDFSKLNIENKFQSVLYSFIFLLFEERVNEENIEIYYDNVENFLTNNEDIEGESEYKSQKKLQLSIENHLSNLKYEIIYLEDENNKNEIGKEFLKNFYFKINEKTLFPVFSKNIFPEININSMLFNFKNYKYLDLYIDERLLNKYNSLSINKYLNQISNSKYIFSIINDIFSLGVIILNEKMKFKTLYDDVDNEDFIILQQRNNFFYPVVLMLGDDKKYIIPKSDEVYDDIINTDYEESYSNTSKSLSLDLSKSDTLISDFSKSLDLSLEY